MNLDFRNVKESVKKRPVLFLVILGVLIFLAGVFAAGLFFIDGRGEMAVEDSVGVPGYDKGNSEDYAPSPESPMAPEGQGGGSGSGTMDSGAMFDVDKIIYTGSISLSSEDYKGTLIKIVEHVKANGGFVQDSNSYFMDESQGRESNSGSITIRVPAEKFESTMEELQTYGEPLNTSVNSTNISQQYRDIKGQLENLKIQESRLMEYLRTAEKLQDMLAIESELNRVRTEMDYRTTLIKNWDVEIAYSTIYVSVYERKLATTQVTSPFGDMLEKIRESFIASLNYLLYLMSQAILWFFRLIPFAVIGLVIVGVILLVRRNQKKPGSK